MNDILPKIYLVRHGQTAWTMSGQHTGHKDIPLTDRGERDAQELSARLKGLSFAKVLTSPLQRARRTAELAGFGERAEADPDLMEWNYGSYEGRSTSDIRTERSHWRLFEDGCPGGETLAEISGRADRVISRIRSFKSDVLLFGHRDIFRILIARWVLLPALEARRFHLETVSISMVGYNHDLEEPIIHMLNDVGDF